MGCRTPEADGQPQNGIYRMTNSVEANDCMPVFGVVGVQAAVFVNARGANLPLPVAPGRLERVDVPAGQTQVAYEAGLCGATRAWLVEIVEGDREHIVVKRTATWSGTATADRSCERAVEVPAADCATLDQVRYDLKEVCGCNAIVENAGEVSCGCQK